MILELNKMLLNAAFAFFINMVFNARMDEKNQIQADKELIESLGGPTRLAERLGFDKTKGGVQRVQNWMTRGIPPKEKLARPDIFLQQLGRRTSDPIPQPGHGGRQPPKPHNILDTVPDSAVMSPIPAPKA